MSIDALHERIYPSARRNRYIGMEGVCKSGLSLTVPSASSGHSASHSCFVLRHGCSVGSFCPICRHCDSWLHGRNRFGSLGRCSRCRCSGTLCFGRICDCAAAPAAASYAAGCEDKHCCQNGQLFQLYSPLIFRLL